MIWVYPCSTIRFRWVRRFCAILCVVAGGCSGAPLRAQNIDLEKPLNSINEDVTAFAFGPDGRIVYSVRQLLKTKKYDLQRDDIWLQDANGKRRRLLQGDKLVHSNPLFSYSVDSFRFAPDGHTILAELFVTLVTDESGATSDTQMALLLDDSGKLLKIGDSKDFLFEAIHPGWLADGSTVAFLKEALKPHLLFSMFALHYASERPRPVFEGRTFLDADWFPRTNSALAVERDRNLSGPPRLQRLDLAMDGDKELATLEGFTGGLSISPSGKLCAYYIDNEVLEVRDLASPNRVARVRVGLGVFQWSPAGDRILLKRAPERKSGDLVWIDLPPLNAAPAGTPASIVQPTPVPLFHNLAFREFAISSDGRFLALVAPGKHNLQVFPLSR
jgi:hypothetical protein